MKKTLIPILLLLIACSNVLKHKLNDIHLDNGIYFEKELPVFIEIKDKTLKLVDLDSVSEQFTITDTKIKVNNKTNKQYSKDYSYFKEGEVLCLVHNNDTLRFIKQNSIPRNNIANAIYKNNKRKLWLHYHNQNIIFVYSLKTKDTLLSDFGLFKKKNLFDKYPIYNSAFATSIIDKLTTDSLSIIGYNQLGKGEPIYYTRVKKKLVIDENIFGNWKLDSTSIYNPFIDEDSFVFKKKIIFSKDKLIVKDAQYNWYLGIHNYLYIDIDFNNGRGEILQIDTITKNKMILTEQRLQNYYYYSKISR